MVKASYADRREWSKILKRRPATTMKNITKKRKKKKKKKKGQGRPGPLLGPGWYRLVF